MQTYTLAQIKIFLAEGQAVRNEQWAQILIDLQGVIQLPHAEKKGRQQLNAQIKKRVEAYLDG